MSFDTISSILSQELYGNSLWRISTSIIVFIVVAVIFYIIIQSIVKGFIPFSKKKKFKEDEHIFGILKTIKTPSLLFIAFFAGIKVLNIPEIIQKITGTLATIIIGYHILLGLELLVSHIIRKKLQREEGDEFALSIFGLLLKWAIWIIGTILLLANLGINVTSLIAGLGIGGVAIALASQNVISDLISYFAIHFDRPFAIGDYITMGDISGRVEKIGIKTTRVRGKDGEEVIIPNKEITSKLLQNYKKRDERKIKFECIITTPITEKGAEQLQEKLKVAINELKDCQFHYAHVHDFAEHGVSCTIACYIPSSNDLTFMKYKEDVFLKIKKVFDGLHLELA